MRITKVKARQVFDSRGTPTVEAEVHVGSTVASAIVPSGASTGIHESLELRDGGTAYHGKGVTKAVANANAVGRKLVGHKYTQKDFDGYLERLEGDRHKHLFGANADLALSMAYCRAMAQYHHVPLYRHVASLCGKKRIQLPVPAMNMINGGMHAGTRLDFQECLLYPKGRSFADMMRTGVEIYWDMKAALKKKYGPLATNVGDEGGFAPPFDMIEKALLFLDGVVKGRAKIGLDVAASSFYKNGSYKLCGKKTDTAQLLRLHERIINRFKLASVEDPFQEEDFVSFGQLLAKVRNKCLIVGDDLLVTQTDRIQWAIDQNSCNCLLLKLNQVGTVSEAIDAGLLAQENGWKVMVSHRSGDTEDPFIADFACGIGADFIKSGAPCRSERVAKYNRLLRIEEEI
ncbi:phosphopyruvate hydratase [Candidatus Woesearchaeota archaeon]|nr:phosphopyruvate hydratase [Candidatus Woesearchaeota archaeon]